MDPESLHSSARDEVLDINIVLQMIWDIRLCPKDNLRTKNGPTLR